MIFGNLLPLETVQIPSKSMYNRQTNSVHSVGVLDHFKGGLRLPEGGPDAVVWKRFRLWLDAIESRPSVKNTTSELEHYIPLYARYANNTAQSELAKATRAGTGVP